MPARSLTGKELRANFWWMSACFAVIHGCVTTPLVVSTTALGGKMATFGNGVLYAMTIFASLFVAAPVVGSLGSKVSLLSSMFLYCIYAGGFALALLFKDLEEFASAVFAASSVCGGLAAGVCWTAQGSYFSSSATLLAAAEGQGREAATSRLAGIFASLYLLFEVVSKLGYSGLQSLRVEPWLIGLVYMGLGLLAWAIMFRVHRFTQPNDHTTNPLAKVWAVTSLWSDPLIWLLSPTNLSFGFSAAFMNGYINGTFASTELGPKVVGALAAITAGTAALFARPFGALSGSVGKGPVIVLGAACFLCVPLCFFMVGCCEGWGWWLILLYLVQGIGRAVYESINRATFSDFFVGLETESAFANCMLQSSLSFAVCYFLQTTITGRALAGLVFLLAALTPCSYAGAREVQKRRLRRRSQEKLLPLEVDGSFMVQEGDTERAERNFGA